MVGLDYRPDEGFKLFSLKVSWDRLSAYVGMMWELTLDMVATYFCVLKMERV